MEAGFKSRALEVNLAKTRQEHKELPERHRWFVDLSSEYWGIHKRTEKLFVEYNHPHPNFEYIIEKLHEISLTDLWLYCSIADSEEALLFLVSTFEELWERDLREPEREQLVKTIFKFIDRLIKEGKFPDQAIEQCLGLIEKGITEYENIFLRNSGYFKKYLGSAAALPQFEKQVCRLTKTALQKSCAYWSRTTDSESWFDSKAGLFQPIYRDKIKLIGKDFFKELSGRIETSTRWEDIEANLFFNDIANHFRQFSEVFELSAEKVYYLIYALHIPGMIQLKKHLLYDLNRLLKTVLAELEHDEIYRFLEMLFGLFRELKEQQTDT
ncbi:MAG TPA: hypothetical protein ENN91_05025, partial [Firmicutes bacterium]|nr:hypothetical protein [Bacillota bacterium]